MRHIGKATGAAAAIALAVTLVKPQEGFVPYVYRDAVGVLTYCYGETQDAKDQQGKRFTEAQCALLLERRMAHYDQGNDRCVANWGSLSVYVRAAFDSFSYNVGNPTFCASTPARLLRSGDVAGACRAMTMYDKGRVKGKLTVLPGLVKRRALESSYCLKGA